MLQIAQNISDLWHYIGTAWSEFENKDVIENFWLALASGVDAINSSMFSAQKSRSLKYLEPILNVGPEWYTITYSGLTANVVEPGNGEFHYELPSYTYELPVLSGVNGTYYEGVDYIISGINTLVWRSAWPTPEYGTSIKLKAPVVNRINPALMSTWARFVGVTLDNFENYGRWGIEKYNYLKYFIWALVYKQSRPPTIKNLTDALGIIKGAPFACNSGILTYEFLTNHYKLYVANDTYVLPAGLTPIPSGIVAQFDLLCNGINVYDHVNNSGIIGLYSNTYNKKNTLVCSLSAAVKNLTHDEELFETYISGIFPCQFRYIYI